MKGYTPDFIPDYGVTLEQHDRMVALSGHPVCFKPQHSAPAGPGPAMTDDAPTGNSSNVVGHRIEPLPRPGKWARHDGFTYGGDKEEENNG